MQLPLRLDAESTLSLQSQIFDQIRQLIMDGRLKPGTRMPASRALSCDLRVSRNTIVLAYDRLIAEGYLESRQPVGTFVSSMAVQDALIAVSPPVTEAPDIPPDRRGARLLFRGRPHIVVSPYDKPVPYDFWVGRPDARLFPIKDWMRIMRSKLRDMQYGNSGYVHPAGLLALRHGIADHVGMARGIKTSAAQVIIVNGTQEALTILSQMFIRPDTPIAIENPCYLGAANVFASHGARLWPVTTDADGIVVDQLPSDPAFVYLTPSHQYPSGAMLSAVRRRQLLEWADHNHSYILEDDYNSDFSYDQAPLPALKSQDMNDQVIYLGTFSKSLGAGLRAGYMILPEHLVPVATMAKGLLNNCCAWAVQALLAEFLISGAYHRHLRRIRTVYAIRRNRLVEAISRDIPGGKTFGKQCGMHIIWKLPCGWPTAFELERKARDVGVGVYSFSTGNSMMLGNTAEQRYAHSVMMGYAALNEDEISEGVRRLATLTDGLGH